MFADVSESLLLELESASLTLLALKMPPALAVSSRVTVTVAPMVTPFASALVAFSVEQLYSLLSEVRITRSFIEALIIMPVSSLDGAVSSPVEAVPVVLGVGVGVAVTDGVAVGVGVTSTALESEVSSLLPHPVIVNAVIIAIVINSTFTFFIIILLLYVSCCNSQSWLSNSLKHYSTIKDVLQVILCDSFVICGF